MKKSSIGGFGLALAAILAASPLFCAAAVADPLPDAGPGASSPAAAEIPSTPEGLTSMFFVDDDGPVLNTSLTANDDGVTSGYRISATDEDDAVVAEVDVDQPDFNNGVFVALELPDYSLGETWTVSAQAIGLDGSAISEAVDVTAYAPLAESPVITSVTSDGLHSPRVVVTWTYSIDIQPEQLTGFLIGLTPIGGEDREPYYFSRITVGPDVRTATFTSVGAHYIGETDPDSAATTPLANSAGYEVYVYPLTDGPASVGDEADSEITTGAVQTPAAPAEPTTSIGGVHATLTAGRLTATGPSLAPGSWVYGYAFSSPLALGWAQVTAEGTVSWTISAQLAPGAHHLAVLDNDGALIGAAAFSVGGARTLAETGVEAASPFALAAILLVGGAALIAVRGVRRSRIGRSRT